jgi:micrococcal nuclease
MRAGLTILLLSGLAVAGPRLPWALSVGPDALALAAAESSQPQPISPPQPASKPQLRAHGIRVAVPPNRLEVDDGDTVLVRWNDADVETVRILGIDAPETRHIEHEIPYAQPFGPEARAFAEGAFAAATQIELLRAATLDPFDRTLGYLFLNGRNYSVLVIYARYAEETVSVYGDNGLPREAAEVSAAARHAGPLPFESPADYRRRMRALSRWMKARGVYPEQ